MLNRKFFKSASCLIGSTLVLNLTQGFGAVADFNDIVEENSKDWSSNSPSVESKEKAFGSSSKETSAIDLISKEEDFDGFSKDWFSNSPNVESKEKAFGSSSKETGAIDLTEITFEPGDLVITNKGFVCRIEDSDNRLIRNILEPGDLIITKSGLAKCVVSKNSVAPVDEWNFLIHKFPHLSEEFKMVLINHALDVHSVSEDNDLVGEDDDSLSFVLYLLGADFLQSLVRNLMNGGKGGILDRSFFANIFAGASKGLKKALGAGNSEIKEVELKIIKSTNYVEHTIEPSGKEKVVIVNDTTLIAL